MNAPPVGPWHSDGGRQGILTPAGAQRTSLPAFTAPPLQSLRRAIVLWDQLAMAVRNDSGGGSDAQSSNGEKPREFDDVARIPEDKQAKWLCLLEAAS